METGFIEAGRQPDWVRCGGAVGLVSCRMTILPGLTSTRKERIPAFIASLRRHGIRRIALFPTCLDEDERNQLYSELATLPELEIPHVHLRSDCSPGEVIFLQRQFGTRAFNIHPDASSYPFRGMPAGFERQIFVENADGLPTREEAARIGGICPDYAHWENARLQGRADHDAWMRRLASEFPIGCCHLSAIRIGDPNDWSGEWDHHFYRSLADFDYLVRYRDFLPAEWASLELENPLEEQLEAAAYVSDLLAVKA
jgi:hypothetical protein